MVEQQASTHKGKMNILFICKETGNDAFAGLSSKNAVAVRDSDYCAVQLALKLLVLLGKWNEET